MGLGITRGWREIRGDDYMVVVRIKMVGDIRRKGLLGLVTDHVKGCGKRDREHPVSKLTSPIPLPIKTRQPSTKRGARTTTTNQHSRQHTCTKKGQLEHSKNQEPKRRDSGKYSFV